MFLGLMRWCLMISQLQHSSAFLSFLSFFFFFLSFSLYTFYILFLPPFYCFFDYGVLY